MWWKHFSSESFLKFLLLLFAIRQAGATTLIPPDNIAHLAAESDGVVLAEALSERSFYKGSLIFTSSAFRVKQVILGPFEPGEVIFLEVPGGSVGQVSWIVPGSPRFEEKSLYFLCLKKKPNSLWVPSCLSLGVLKEEIRKGKKILVPCHDSLHVKILKRSADGWIRTAYIEEAFLNQLREVLKGEARWSEDSVRCKDWEPQIPLKAQPQGCSFFTDSGRRFRWKVFDSGGQATIYSDAIGDLSLPGGGFKEILQALQIWMSIEGAGLNLVFGGSKDSQISCSPDSDSLPNTIVFNDPCNDIPDLENCGGVLAYGGPIARGTHFFDGSTWITCVGWIVVVNNGTGCIGRNAYRFLLAHELGHGLGFDHFEDPNSVMNATCCNSVDETDRICTSYVYPRNPPDNQRPEVSAGGDRVLHLGGNSAWLSCTVSDDGKPSGTLQVSWRNVHGPAKAIIKDPNETETQVTFPCSGKYLFTVTADDGRLIATDYAELTVFVDEISSATVSFKQGSEGYHGTYDTFIQEMKPSAVNAIAPELNVDGDDPNGSGKRVEALLRFEDIFGFEEGKIPPGSLILNANLLVFGTNGGSGAYLYRMKKPWEETDTWESFGGEGIVPGIHAERDFDSKAFALEGPEEINVTESLQAWAEDPCSNLGWAILPAGENGWDFSSSEGEMPPSLTVTYSLFPRILLIQSGDWWHYYGGREEVNREWKEPDYEADSLWKIGKTGIGYGDGDDQTVINDMQGNYLTLYLRKSFSVKLPELVQRLILKADYDDGFVAYLNGKEVARSPSMGVPGGPVDRFTPADSHEAGLWESFQLDHSLLEAGNNVLALEVHNSDIRSSDLSFNARLIAEYRLIGSGDLWKFHRGSAPVPSDWNQLSFDDSHWESGKTQVGFGDGDEETTLSDMQGNYLVVYLRKEFYISDPQALKGVLIKVFYDDGLALYLNGAEVVRENLPSGPLDHTVSALKSVENERTSIILQSSLLRQGRNVLCASVHNSSLQSSDLSFDLVAIPLMAERRSVSCLPTLPFIRGDVNDDGSVNLADPMHLLSWLFAGKGLLACPDAADTNDDGSVDISDAVALLRYLFSSAKLPQPGLVCGEDETTDSLPPCASQSCIKP